MRPVLLAALSAAALAGAASAQTPPAAAQTLPASPGAQSPAPVTPATAIIARPAPTAPPTPIVDQARFPLDIERGDTIIEYSVPSSPRRQFADATASDSALERMILDGAGEVFCGGATESATQAPSQGKPPIMCFSDDNHDGAADHSYAVSQNDGRQMTLAQPNAMAPRAWREEAPANRRIAFRYGGPNSGRVLEGGRLGEGSVEIQVIMVTDLEEHPIVTPRAIGCLDDGRCLPFSVGDNRNVMLSSPMVEGAAHVQLVDDQEASRVRDAVETAAARARAASIAAKGGDAAPAAPAPVPAPDAPAQTPAPSH